MWITIEDTKRHLNIDFQEDDAYLAELISAAESSIECYLQRPLSELSLDGDLNPAVKHAVRVLVGNLYANREAVAFSTPSEIPYGLNFLLMPLKKFN